MNLPLYSDLLEVQRDILDHDVDADLFVAGPPGSGKTSLAVFRIQAAAKNQRVALVTFNRTLRRRCQQMIGVNCTIDTMHTLVGSEWYQRFRESVPQVAPYDFNWAAMCTRPVQQRAFDHLVVDEGQDLPPGFYQYARRFLAKTLTVFADDDQAFHERHSTLEQIADAANLPDVTLLDTNHRNTPEIARLAEFFHTGGRLPAATVTRAAAGEIPQLLLEQNVAHRIATVFVNFEGTVGVLARNVNRVRSLASEIRAKLPNAAVFDYDHEQQNEDQIDFLKRGIVVLTPEAVKGHEFDSLVIDDLTETLPWVTPHQRRKMYMVCSRAKNRLFALCRTPVQLSKLEPHLPPREILAR